MLAGRRQHDVMEGMGGLVKHWWWHLVMLSNNGGEAGIGTAIKATRCGVGAVKVWLANCPAGGDMIMALWVAWHRWAIGACWWSFENLWLATGDLRRTDNLVAFLMRGQLL